VSAEEGFDNAVGHVCEPFRELTPHAKMFLVLGVVAIVSQVCVLVSHHTTYVRPLRLLPRTPLPASTPPN
jgi:hypothetical protein